MCEAIEGIKKDAKEEGIIEGKIAGKIEGKTEGILEILCGLINDGILTIADAATRANMSVPEFIKKTGIKV